jgi:hypothetical protein
MNSKVTGSAKYKPPGGSRKGKPNVATKELKDMILGALSDAGGQKYLAQQAIDNPGAFMGLIGKVLPKDINANVDMQGTVITKVEHIIVKPTA